MYIDSHMEPRKYMMLHRLMEIHILKPSIRLLNAVDQVTRTDVANALGISKPQAYRLIMKLFNKGNS